MERDTLCQYVNYFYVNGYMAFSSFQGHVGSHFKFILKVNFHELLLEHVITIFQVTFVPFQTGGKLFIVNFNIDKLINEIKEHYYSHLRTVLQQ